MMKTTNKLLKSGTLLATTLLTATNALAGIFVITDDAAPASKGDLELSLNWESAIATNHSTAVGSASALELAYGAAENLELTFAFDFGHAYIGHGYAHKTGEKYGNDFNFTGISIGLKNQILDAEDANNPFGLSFVGGFSWAWASPNQDSARDITFELGLIFQKNFLDGDWVFAFTPSVAFTSLKGDSLSGSTDSAFDSTEYSLAAGTSYALGDGFRVGIESVYSIVYNADGFDEDQFYAGPNICYEADNWWITAAVAPRLFTSADEVLFIAQLGYVF